MREKAIEAKLVKAVRIHGRSRTQVCKPWV